MSPRWDESQLDRLRRVGDPLADDAVAAVFASGQLAAVRKLMATLINNDDPIPAELPPELKAYLDHSAKAAEAGFLPAEDGEKLFAEHGPEILLILACYSLPMAYGARKGVQVLYRTAFLQKRPNQRLFQTMQMVVDVMKPGGLGPRGKGIRTAQKVRLMHAAIRSLLVNDPGNPWNPEFGVPINQEDLAGTLMTFSWIVLDGLRKLEVEVEPKRQQAYLDTWLDVGRLLGVSPELLPRDLSAAGELTGLILKRQLLASEEGQKMLAALLDMMKENSPILLRGFPAASMRWFLPPPVADGLQVPNIEVDRLIAVAFAAAASGFDRIVASSNLQRRLFRCFSMSFIQWMINFDLGPRSKFNVPKDLHDGWQNAPGGPEQSLWWRLVSRYL